MLYYLANLEWFRCRILSILLNIKRTTFLKCEIELSEDIRREVYFETVQYCILFILADSAKTIKKPPVNDWLFRLLRWLAQRVERPAAVRTRKDHVYS